jgi:hypothetical protein
MRQRQLDSDLSGSSVEARMPRGIHHQRVDGHSEAPALRFKRRSCALPILGLLAIQLLSMVADGGFLPPAVGVASRCDSLWHGADASRCRPGPSLVAEGIGGDGALCKE